MAVYGHVLDTGAVSAAGRNQGFFQGRHVERTPDGWQFLDTGALLDKRTPVIFEPANTPPRNGVMIQVSPTYGTYLTFSNTPRSLYPYSVNDPRPGIGFYLYVGPVADGAD